MSAVKGRKSMVDRGQTINHQPSTIHTPEAQR